MAGRLFRNIWNVLNTEIELSWETPAAGVGAVEKLFALANVLKENKDAAELKPIIDNLDSVLDVLNSPLGKVAQQSLPFIPIATFILKYVVEKTRGEPTLADSVELVSQVAYLESLRQFLRDRPEIQLQEKEASDEVKKKIKKLGEGIGFKDGDAKETLICFHDSPLTKAFNEILRARLEESGLAADVAATVTERVSRSAYRYMKEAVVEVKDSAKKLAGIYGDGWQRDLEAYGSIDKYLKDVITAKPEEKVFDEGFTFRQIYVPLQVQQVKSDGEVDRSAEPENIEEWAKRTLLDEKKRDRVLFVQAGPGRGKSVFCRMFGDLAREELHPIYTPILIRLRDVTAFENNIDETLSAAVGWDFVSSDDGWLTDRNTRFLFLLDGFDELLLERGARYDLKVFLEQVAQFQKRAAENSERGHRVLITGRPLALYGMERLMPQNLERVRIEPMAGDIQEQWLTNWQTVVDANPTEAVAKTEKFREFLRDHTCPEQVKELAREPLLLYLLAAMHRDGQLEAEMFAGADAGQGKVLVYEQALEWVLEKQRGQGGDNLNLKLTGLESAEDLRALLQETGLCVVQSGREYAAISTIESRLREKEDEGAITLIENARQTDSDNALKNALAAFYLKSAAGAENSVEFFHKSFGEFLCAERMAETIEEWTSPGKKRKKFAVSPEELNKQVYDLFGYGALTAEVVEYLMALLVKKENENKVDLVVLFERLYEFYLCWCDGEFIQETGETVPQTKAKQLQQQKIERGQRDVDIYTGLNVMILLLELHRYGQSREQLREKTVFRPCGKSEDEDFDRTRLLRIIGYSQCLGAVAFGQIVGKFLTGANLSGADLSGANLRGADLSGAYLRGVDLTRAYLSGANLSGADLRGANLSGADLSGADLSGANLRGANLSGANLSGADLTRANLSGANLSGANLSGANLSGAKLSGANLSSADLSSADLSGADLSGADLSGADLSGANLSGADLSRAHLSRANLSRADLSRADLSSADLSGANLSGADLSGADLSGADLSGANLIRANLSDADLSGANLSNIKWNRETAWSHAVGLHETTVVPEALKQHPEFAAAVVLSRGYSQAQEGEVDEAILAYNEAQTISPQLRISARFWENLCWYGCLHDHAPKVLFAGEKAVELEPDNRTPKETRGLARALTGDIAGAIEDFQAASDSRVFYYLPLDIERFLEALRAGENPFTPEELAKLRRKRERDDLFG